MRFLILAALCLGMVGTARCEETVTFKCAVKDYEWNSPYDKKDKEVEELSRNKIFEITDAGDRLRVRSTTKNGYTSGVDFFIIGRNSSYILATRNAMNIGVGTIVLGLGVQPNPETGNIVATLTDQTFKAVFVFHLLCDQN
ncbi:hypothetical protein [Pleomorphomonas oryzae]|uniref:hypothetical protein n=1 Tax=Pleomorphomonas oryzae TaxID=261934 RepID=UPI00047DA41D|nr:hypothetical protein [Pleomorphomonas oryzae]